MAEQTVDKSLGRKKYGNVPHPIKDETNTQQALSCDSVDSVFSGWDSSAGSPCCPQCTQEDREPSSQVTTFCEGLGMHAELHFHLSLALIKC